jgi:hypothetical protein
MSVEIAQILDACVVEQRFIVPPPGRLRIERSPTTRRVFLDRPDMPSDRPLIDVCADGECVRVIRHVAMRDGSWIEEHVGTAPPRRDLIERCVEMALVGTSRLPITSIETPLPAYSLGMIAYRSADPARMLDIALRTSSKVPDDVDASTLRSLFNLLTLSPHTRLIDNLVALLRRLPVETGRDAAAYMIRHLVRHLNAFDLERFHNRGANYPDALLLDALVQLFIERLDDTPPTRAALLLGWLARKRLEGVAVPATPTSPGEVARFMPAWYQSGDPADRSRRLFANEPAEAMLTPAASNALRHAAAEIDVVELGRATFLDRPLGVTKGPREPDRTALLSYESFSRRLAQRRATELVTHRVLTSPPEEPGFPVAKLPRHARDGVVSLEDAKKVALDFVFTRTTRSSLDMLLRQYDFAAALGNAGASDAYRWLCDHRHVLLIRTAAATMTAFDADMRSVFTIDLSGATYREFAGEELAEGLTMRAGDSPQVPLPPR